MRLPRGHAGFDEAGVDAQCPEFALQEGERSAATLVRIQPKRFEYCLAPRTWHQHFGKQRKKLPQMGNDCVARGRLRCENVLEQRNSKLCVPHFVLMRIGHSLEKARKSIQ